MSDPDETGWVDMGWVDALTDAPDMSEYAETNGRVELDDPSRGRLSIQRLGVFRKTVEATAESLIGPPNGTILPADGTVLMYGDGGAGKTTLTVDGLFHMAAGRKWLGLDVERSVKSLIVENEGPRGMFRRRLDEKAEAFGIDVDDAIAVLDEPWSRFTLKDAGLRNDLVDVIVDEGFELLVLGPLATVGMVGGGTPDEVSAFEGLVRELRHAVGRPLALWIVHHENKAGDVSGAWERVPDTLVHVQAQGNGHTRVVWRKARWSSLLHGTTLNLVWRDGLGFEVAEDTVRDYYSDVLDVFRELDDWRTFKEIRDAVHADARNIRPVLNALVERGDLRYEQGPKGRAANAKCWRLNTLRLVPDPSLDDLDL